MKIEKREDGINLIPESDFELECLRWMKNEIVARMQFENAWERKGKLIIDFDNDWGR